MILFAIFWTRKSNFSSFFFSSNFGFLTFNDLIWSKVVQKKKRNILFVYSYFKHFTSQFQQASQGSTVFSKSQGLAKSYDNNLHYLMRTWLDFHDLHLLEDFFLRLYAILSQHYQKKEAMSRNSNQLLLSGIENKLGYAYAY